MKEIQIPGRKSKYFRKEIQEKAEGNPRKTGRNSKHLSSADPAFSRTYADPHGIFHFLRRFRRCGAAATQALRVRLELFFGPFFLRFGASGLFQQVRAGAVLRSRAHGRGLRPTCRPRAAKAPKGNRGPWSVPGSKPGDRGPAEKDRPIDPTSGKKFACKRARTGFRAQTSGRAPALHCLKSISQCLPSSPIPLVRRLRGGCGRFPSGALRAPFIQR